uniref:Paraoxonase n=1 Tax=Acrobeloides nanus TaxID=290746 RepID=A0A914BXM8_9BILA
MKAQNFYFAFPIAGVLSYLVIHTFYYLDINKRTYNHVPGECSYTYSLQSGASDFEIYNGTLFCSTGLDLNNASNSSGALFAWNLAEREAYQLELVSKKPPKNFNPHGISIYGRSLMAVNIRDEQFDSIEIFRLPTNYPYRRIKHIKTVENPLMTGLRDVVAVSENQFYATNRHYFRGKTMKKFEFLTNLRLGSVIFYDGHKIHLVLTRIATPTGIVFDHKKKHLYVASYTDEKILIYDANGTELTKINEIHLGTAPYFLIYEQSTLTFYVAAHPVKMRYFFYENSPDQFMCPTQVLQIKKKFKKDKWSFTQLFSNDGATISGGTIAWKTPQQKLLIGNIHTGILSCDLTAV